MSGVPLLGGPTGIRIGSSGSHWVWAFYRGVPIVGIPFKVARGWEDGGRRFLYECTGAYWGHSVAEKVIRGGVTFDE